MRRGLLGGPPELRRWVFGLPLAAITVLAVVLLQPLARVPTYLVLGLALLLGLLDGFEIPFSIGKARIRVVFVDAAVLLAYGLVGGPWAVLLSTGAVLVAEMLHPRAGFSRMFNVCNNIIGTGLGAIVVLALPIPSIEHPHAWPALVLGTVVRLAVVGAVIAIGMSRMRATRLRSELAAAIPRNLVSGGTSLSLTVLVLVLYRYDRGALVLLPVWALGIGYLAVRYLRTRSERDVLRRLSEVSSPSPTRPLEEVVADVEGRAGALFDLEEVVVDLRARPVDRSPWVDDGTLHLPLHVGQPVGVIRMSWPVVQGPLTDDDRRVMTTFATTAAVMIANSMQRATIEEQAEAASTLARTDPVTGLPNRLALADLAPPLLDAATDLDGVALLLLDLDHFKEVNEGLGHATGDELIRQVAARLTQAARPGDVVARIGGDEFAVLMTGVPGDGGAVAADRLLRRLAEPFMLAGVAARPIALPVEASVGAAVSPLHATDLDALLRCADVALYQAKARRGTSVVYDRSTDPSLDDRLGLLADLHQAIAEPQGQIVVHYQPKVSLQADLVVGAEALVRWRRDDRLQPPDTFIPLAERCALIGPLTDLVLEQSVTDCVRWQTRSATPMGVAVNVSPRVLLDRTFPSRVALVLARHGLPAGQLTLEITETLAVSDSAVVEEVLDALHGLGVRLSVDDFGTGFSSLTFLTRLAVHEIKIDRQFVATMATDPKAASLIRTTVELAHRMDAVVVAEGVETADQMTELRFVGCDAAQGWHFGRPVPHEALMDRLGDSDLEPAV